jgi:hypothetical protein
MFAINTAIALAAGAVTALVGLLAVAAGRVRVRV